MFSNKQQNKIEDLQTALLKFVDIIDEVGDKGGRIKWSISLGVNNIARIASTGEVTVLKPIPLSEPSVPKDEPVKNSA